MAQGSCYLDKQIIMKIDSTKVSVNATEATIKSFITDSRNLNHLLPQDNIKDFEADEKQCSFKVQGGVTITLIQDGQEDGKVFLKSGEKSPFPFRLTVHLNEAGEATEGYIAFDGEVNMFMKMMVEKPLTNLFNYMSHKLEKHFA